jgi:hypothetical protein
VVSLYKKSLTLFTSLSVTGVQLKMLKIKFFMLRYCLCYNSVNNADVATFYSASKAIICGMYDGNTMQVEKVENREEKILMKMQPRDVNILFKT